MKYGLLLTALVTLAAMPLWAEETHVKITDAYAYAPIGAGKVAVGFMAMAHDDPQEDYTLLGASSPLFERVELHDHLMEDGVMRMREVESIRIPAGETVTLKSGGLHLMLFGAKQEIQPGDSIPLQLTFQPGTKEIGLVHELTLPVKARR